MYNSEQLQEKWQPVLNHPDLPEITDSYKRAVTAVILENQERELQEQKTMLAEADTSVASVAYWDPVLISLVRRAMPNLMAYDICGVQPMSGPTGLIFAMKARLTGGATSNTLTADQIPTHTHSASVTDPGHQHSTSFDGKKYLLYGNGLQNDFRFQIGQLNFF